MIFDRDISMLGAHFYAQRASPPIFTTPTSFFSGVPNAISDWRSG